MHKTTVNLTDELHLWLRHLSARTGRSVGNLVNELLEEALRARGKSQPFASHGAGEADVTDLGRNAEKYLAEGLR
jgi:hypothetical protein